MRRGFGPFAPRVVSPAVPYLRPIATRLALTTTRRRRDTAKSKLRKPEA